MIGNLAEPNLTQRLDLLAEARRDDKAAPTSDGGKGRDRAAASGAIGHRQDPTRAASRAFYARHC